MILKIMDPRGSSALKGKISRKLAYGTEQNRSLFRTPKGYKAHEDTAYYIIDGIGDSVACNT